jgi:outer membrane protein assembly factor BamB
LKAGDGAVVWTKDFAKDFNAPSRGWGFCESLLVDGEKLLCSPGSKNALMVALNKLTGEVIWQCKVPDKINTEQGNGYSSIVIAEVGGVKQYINLFCTGVGLAGVEAKTGKLLWNYRKVSNGTAAIPTAIVKDDYVFASSGYNTGAVLLKLVPDGKGGIDAKEEYFLNGGKLQNHHGGMIMVGDHIYGGNGHDNGQPFCLEWKTGKVAWLEKRGAGGGSAAVVFADGHLYFRYQDGRMALIEATPKEYNLKSSFNVPLSNPGWQHPVIYHGRLYLRGNDQILCYDIKQ